MKTWKEDNLLGRVREDRKKIAKEYKEKVVARDKKHLIKLIVERINEFGYRCDLNDIDVSHITNMSGLFWVGSLYKFNGDISQWDVSNVKNMAGMFELSRFNGDISKWDVSNVEDMSQMFMGARFKGDISNWDVSNVKHMNNMFTNSSLKGNEPDWYTKRYRKRAF